MRLIYIAHRTQQYDSPMGANNPDPGATVVLESRSQIGTLFAFLIVACAAALVRGLPAAQTTFRADGRRGYLRRPAGSPYRRWIVMIRRPRRLEITEDAVSYVQRNGQVASLSRRQGDELRFVKQLRGRTWRLGLTIVGTDTIMLVGTFSRKSVRQACVARGWRFDDQAVVRR